MTLNLEPSFIFNSLGKCRWARSFPLILNSFVWYKVIQAKSNLIKTNGFNAGYLKRVIGGVKEYAKIITNKHLDTDSESSVKVIQLIYYKVPIT